MSGRRFLASTIDWLVCALVPFVVVGTLWFAVVPLIVVAYFACFLFVGRTVGMRMASIHVVDRRTGGRPRVGIALARSLAALLQAVALTALVLFAFSDAPAGGYSTADLVAFALSGLVALAALLAHLWLFVDAERRTVLDRLFGLAVVSRTGRRAGSRLPAG